MKRGVTAKSESAEATRATRDSGLRLVVARLSPQAFWVSSGPASGRAGLEQTDEGPGSQPRCGTPCANSGQGPQSGV